MAGASTAVEKVSTASEQLRESLDFPEEYMEPAYTHGVALYEHGRYDEAEKVFQLLAACDSANPVVWKALGSARKMAGRYEDAVAAYRFAVNAGSIDPWIPVHAAECLMHLQRHEDAVAALRHAALAAKLTATDTQPIRQRIEVLLNGVDRAVSD